LQDSHDDYISETYISGTRAFIDFFKSQYSSVLFDTFVTTLIEYVDNSLEVTNSIVNEAVQALGDLDVSPLPRQFITPSNEMKKHEGVFAQMMLCRMVDSYLTYVSDLLTIIFQTRPEMLKSNEKVPIEFILEHGSMNELLHALVEEKVHKLSYKGFRELNEYMFEQYGLLLVEEGDPFTALLILIEVRNLLSHNRGVINRVFCERVPDFAIHIGKTVPVEYEKIKEHRSYLLKVTKALDRRAIEKFKLSERKVALEELK
jgi:hypothetical protein